MQSHAVLKRTSMAIYMHRASVVQKSKCMSVHGREEWKEKRNDVKKWKKRETNCIATRVDDEKKTTMIIKRPQITKGTGK